MTTHISASTGAAIASRRFRLPLAVVLLISAMLAWLALRLGLWLSLGSERPDGMGLIHPLILGTWFDAWTMSYLLAPLLLVSAVLPNRLRLSRVGDWGVRVCFGWLWPYCCLASSPK